MELLDMEEKVSDDRVDRNYLENLIQKGEHSSETPQRRLLNLCKVAEEPVRTSLIHACKLRYWKTGTTLRPFFRSTAAINATNPQWPNE